MHAVYLSPITRANIRRLYADIFWFGVLSGGAMAFLSIYAARLGAGATSIGWLTAGPALLNLAISLPVGRWLERRPLVRTTFLAALIQRLGYLALAALPWLFVDRLQINAVIILTVLMSAPATLVAIGFNALFAEVVPADQRADVVGRRNALLALSQTISTLIAGQLLDRIAFPYNYQIVFLIGAFGGVLSAYYVGRLQAPDRRLPAPALPEPEPIFDLEEAELEAEARGIASPRIVQVREEARRLADRLSSPAALRLSRLNLGLLRGAFGRFMLAYLLFYTFQYLCLPVFPLAYVHNMHLTDGMISFGSVLFYVTMFFVSLRLGPMARRWGDQRMLGISGILFGAYPLILGLGNQPALYYLANFVGGMIYAVISAALVNRLMARVPNEQRSAGMAFHNLALNLGILIGSLTGPLLGNALGVQSSLIAGAGLRALAGLLLLLWG